MKLRGTQAHHRPWIGVKGGYTPKSRRLPSGYWLACEENLQAIEWQEDDDFGRDSGEYHLYESEQRYAEAENWAITALSPL